jgi:YfiH family protein
VIITTSAGNLHQSRSIAAIPGIVHGFGVRAVHVNAYLDALGVRTARIWTTDQIHGDRVHHLAGEPCSEVQAGDAFIANEGSAVCFVRTADCVPILIADPVRRAVAAVHAGWRGTAVNIVGRTVRELTRAFGTRPQDCIAAIGPRICGSCYEVGDEVREAMSLLHLDVGTIGSGSAVDLGIVNRALLTRSGISGTNIELMPHCTRCDDSFASYRREKTDAARQFSFILCSTI